VSVCSLLDKPSRREVHVDIDYLGFTVDNVFIVGYGLDVAQRYRNLPYITSVRVEDD
jgi:hypoxanthine phosphoribosyltransferase